MEFGARGALIGMILGDGCIRIRKRYEPGRIHQTQSVFQCSHSIKQLPYATYKADRVNQILGGKAKMSFYEVRLKDRTIPYKMCRFVKVNKYFGHLREWLYEDGKKVINQRCLDWLSDEGFAYLFLDDGWSNWWKNKSGIISSLQAGIAICRPVQECDLFLSWIEQKYRITGRIISSNKNNMLKFKTQEAIKIHQIVRPFTPKSMLYKVDPNYVPHEHQAPGKLRVKI